MKLNLKLVSLIIILLLSVSTYAETFTAATITSDYLARGITQNNGESAVQGKIEESEIIPNSLVGLWLSNAVGSNNTAESEVDLYARYNLISDDNVKLSFLALFYYYTKTHAFNTWDYQIIFENSYANLLFSYRDDFFEIS